MARGAASPKQTVDLGIREANPATLDFQTETIAMRSLTSEGKTRALREFVSRQTPVRNVRAEISWVCSLVIS